MSIAVFLKNNLKNIPPSFGKYLNSLPYSYRPGLSRTYRIRKLEIKEFEAFTQSQKELFIFNRIKKLVDFSFENIPFYKEFYTDTGFSPSQLKNFEDIHKIPIITKGVLNEYALDERSYPQKGRYVVNTGGSSGTPFGFYIEPSSMGHEWAHMHTIWEKLNYKPSDFKILFGGRSDIKDLVEYDVIRNHFAIDIYAGYSEVCKKLLDIVKKHPIKYLHGYPSSIYEFAEYCDLNEPELTQILRSTLKGAFLGSEYPQPYYRDKIEEVFGIKTISWYGHTERAVLAYEKNRSFEYAPFQTYGYSEAIKNAEGQYELIATSYYNYASPLIRYNTEDVIEKPKFKDNILDTFEILKGRSGEFVIDKSGNKINLTGLIFGRHHELFNYSKFIQVRQLSKGEIEILYVADDLSEEKAFLYFDKENLNFDLSFKRLEEPVRTVFGKISLLIK